MGDISRQLIDLAYAEHGHVCINSRKYKITVALHSYETDVAHNLCDTDSEVD
jgi:hypothetical protein